MIFRRLQTFFRAEVNSDKRTGDLNGALEESHFFESADEELRRLIDSAVADSLNRAADNVGESSATGSFESTSKKPLWAFSLLGLTPRATRNEVRIAFREKIKQVHPDISKNTDTDDGLKQKELTQQIISAYRILMS